MGHLHHVQRIEAPLEYVWKLGMETERIPEWNPYQELRKLSGPFDVVGTTFEGTVKVLGRPLEATGTIIEVERPKLIHFKAISPTAGPSDWIYRYEAAGTGTVVTLDIDYDLPGGLFGGMLDKLFVERTIERQTAQAMENFAALAAATALQPV